jgi:protein-arginine kinase activator protein McsA
MEELQKLLDEAVKEEDYDTALEIQEEIKRRKKKID